ncbi:MAG TPA: hypothetical protein VFJ02_17525 [Vicinamibacterales bacterium]|nr:hypothetical protein [Vicinamibacterales bacterium]
MGSRVASTAGLFAAAWFVLSAPLSPTGGFAGPEAATAGVHRDPQNLVVHEWGTFTSVAADDGSAMTWVPQQGPADLPCFVRDVKYGLKGWLLGTVRMETPVLYFYAPRETTVDVKVRFNRGVVTEWYPDAEVAPARVDTATLLDPNVTGTVTWRHVRVLPDARAPFAADGSDNHYYVARRTDASPVRVGTQDEKFLFYRGVGNFAPPLRATIGGDRSVVVTSESGAAIGDVILFENRRGRSMFRAAHLTTARATLAPLSPNASSASPRDALLTLLVEHGLYRKEAAAMVDTWRDSWFEEGTRIFYILPTPMVDARLPLEISPAPDAVSRVFVGRLELIPRETLEDVRRALAARDRAGIARHGRFLRPILERLGLNNVQPGTPAAATAAFGYSALSPTPRSCH